MNAEQRQREGGGEGQGRRGRSSGVNMHHCSRLMFDQTTRSVQQLNLQREQVRASREESREEFVGGWSYCR